MENLTVKERKTKTGGERNGPRTKTKFYTKVEDDIYDLFVEKDVRLTYRMIYMALSGCMIPNSEFAEVKFKALRIKSGAGSDSTLTAALKELSKKGFISKMGGSTYRLWHCVYKGVRENEKEYSELKESTTPSVVAATTLGVVPHVRVLSCQLTKEQQHETDDVNFKNLTFGEGSPFKNDIPIWQWRSWIKKYNFEWCQKMVEELECAYGKNYEKIKSPVKLMAKGLTDGKQWQLERKRLEDAKKFEEELAKKKEQEKHMDRILEKERMERDIENEKNDLDYAEAIKQPYLIERAIECLEASGIFPKEGSDCYPILLRHKVVKEYQEALI